MNLIPQGHSVFVVNGLLQPVLGASRDPLVEVAGIPSVFKEQAHQTILDLKRVEKLPVLVVGKIDPQLLVPHYAAVAKDVHHLEKERMSHQIIHQRNRSNQARVRPFCGQRICNVKPGYCGIYDLVVRLWNSPFDFFLVGSGQDSHVDPRLSS